MNDSINMDSTIVELITIVRTIEYVKDHKRNSITDNSNIFNTNYS